MKTRCSHFRIATGAAPLLIAAALGRPAGAQDAQAQSAACIGCHAGMGAATVKFGDGSALSPGVEKGAWEASVHAGKLGCTDCHREISGFPHEARRDPSARAYQLAQSESCKGCHYAYYTRVLDGIHYAQIEKGNAAAPTCVDCHGAHSVTQPHEPRQKIQEKCATCHPAVAAEYAASVHGKDLASAPPGDVPVCTDCHGAHAIEDPSRPSFHASSYTICARCHADEEKMSRYDVNPNVLDTYLDDFHGMSNQLYALGESDPDKVIATCTDCHGTHGIQRFDDGGDVEAVRARVAETCRRCHSEVPDDFADAWLSHFEPSLEKAPLVWAIQWGYRLMIPFIMLGLVLHILLHLWRVRTHR